MYNIKIPADQAARKAAGQAIMRVCETVFQKGAPGAETEWQKFESDPAGWLYDHGYRLETAGAPADGSFPPQVLRIVPVYDTPHVMHVRVPYRDNVDPTIVPPDGSEYGTDFEAFLASYFTRHCR